MGEPNNTNPEYNKYLPIWEKCRDANSGQEAIKSGGQKYLPMLPGQKSDKNNGSSFYSDYKEGAVWYGATGRTTSLLRGLPFRKAPTYEVPTALDMYIDGLTTDSKSTKEVAKKIVEEVIITNRCGVLIDYPAVETSEMTIAEVEQSNIRPYVAIYTAETILDWRETLIDNKKVTSFISLSEKSQIPDPNDEFNYIPQDRVRVLDLDENGLYRVRLYELNDDKYILIQSYNPLFAGSYLSYIPFFPITADGETWELSPPEINDLANLNIAHFINDASYRNGLMLTGNPTPVFKGLDIDKSKDSTGSIRIGSRSALHVAEQGDAYFMQVGSDGFSELRESAKNLESNMALIGSRILAQEKKAAESAQTAEIRQSSENSILSDIVDSVSGVLTKVFRLISEYTLGTSDDSIFYRLNKDFNDYNIDSQKMTTLIGAVQSNLMSKETFFYNLEKGEVYPPGTDFETEFSNIGETESIDDL